MAFKRYKHLNVPDSWERYFTKYPQGMSILESLFEWVSQVDSMVDTQNKLSANVEQFRIEIDEFVGRFDERLQTEVSNTLTDWQNSGFLDVVISEALQWELDNYIATNEQDKLSLTAQLQQTEQELSSQLAQTENDLETKKLDRNENESITMAMLGVDIKTALNDGEWNVSLNTSNIENKAITQSKLDLPTGYLPKTVIYSRGDAGGWSPDTRASSDYISLQPGTIIKANQNIEFSLWYEDDTSPTLGWERNHVIATTEPIKITCRKENNEDIDDVEMNKFSDFVEIITPQTAIQRETYEKGTPINLPFEYGAFSGVDGTNGDEEFTVRVRTNGYVTLPKNSKVYVKDSNTSFAVYVQGAESYYGYTWQKKPIFFKEPTTVRIMQRFDDNSSVKNKFIFFMDNLEIVTEDTFIRGSDVNDFVDRSSNYNDIYQYPPLPAWGHEYMFSWYDKLRKNQPVKMTWAGDSTTENSDLPVEYQRHSLGKKLMTLAGYEGSLITSINAGHGAQHTGNWLGGVKDEDKQTPNGFLDEDMQENPDLYVFGYGFNDGSNSHFPDLTWEERIDRFEENLNEGLERIRGAMYNKSPDDMAIILTTPIAAYDEGRGNTPQVWNDKIRPIIQKACRDYHCAFVDITARQYDHGFSSTWSTNADLVHPNETANVDYMSMFDEVIMPRLLHK